VIALNEGHLRRVIGDYIRYYEQDRTHDSLDKDTPNRRPAVSKPVTGSVIALPRVGGLHHRYTWWEAA
jgi:putative transposase